MLNVAKMLMTGFHSDGVNLFLSIFLSVFFTVHYGGFMAGHGFFLMAILFGGLSGSFNPSEQLPLILEEITIHSPADFFTSELFALMILVVSHGISFYLYFIRDKEYTRANVARLMFTPYRRIVIMHLVIIFGTFIVVSVKGGAAGYFYLLILLKIFFDVRAHLKEKSKHDISVMLL